MNRATRKRQRSDEAGYGLIFAVFLVATMIILAAAAAPPILTEGRRQKEAEMVWRGEQYQRAILLYFRKFGRFPTKIEDLTRPTNGVRFLRQAYTDPMNKDDGSWRFIYSGPNGQLIGSLKQTSLLQNALPTAFGTANPFGGGLQPLGAPGQGTLGAGGTGAAGAAGLPATGAAAPNALESQPQSLTGPVIGGNIIGVGSKVKQHSLRVYLGGDTYEKWEFIANPLGQGQNIPGQAPVNTNGAPGVAPNQANPNGVPNPQDNSQPQQNPQVPTINVPPPVSPAQQ